MLFDNNIPDVVYPVAGILLLLALKFGAPAVARSIRAWWREGALAPKEKAVIPPRAPASSAS